jgi:hypothetical protein
MDDSKEELLSANQDTSESMVQMTNMKVAKKVHSDIIAIKHEITEASGINTSVSQTLDILIKCYRKHGSD